MGHLELSQRLQVDPLQLEVVLENLQALDWVGLLNEDSPAMPPRYVLLAAPFKA
jgi:membrane protein